MTGPLAQDVTRLQATPELLQSLLVMELIRPSQTFCIVGGGLGNDAVVDNRARQFGLLCPDWPAERIRWTGVIKSLLQRGVAVTLILDGSVPSSILALDLERLRRSFQSSLEVRVLPQVETCGMAGDFFAIRGNLQPRRQPAEWRYTADPDVARSWQSALREGDASS